MLILQMATKKEKEIFLNWILKQRKFRNDTEVLDGIIFQLKEDILIAK